jgi:hypothetical protein
MVLVRDSALAVVILSEAIVAMIDSPVAAVSTMTIRIATVVVALLVAEPTAMATKILTRTAIRK